MKEFWYHAYYYVVGETDNMVDDYTCIKSETREQADKEAIQWAEGREVEGEDYVDIGHVKLSLAEVAEVDPNNEWLETRIIYC